ncbi:hypothetical protein SAMN02745248_01268 [Hathewaya proteolytica DSM 3090]|uniref:N-acetyltransferase domain-containing protein n=1 Tax=Hathewaya proteolytica DSM 3090 TaxID=1121331 RepID=A0A1M6N4Q9_9CLOT|nr:hypothetical protein [Hathewaya proteolytica]SHJ90690.1 hypothetical protein SAMN02745248_01268 [Hathewaya proteolytica DSM 3090]
MYRIEKINISNLTNHEVDELYGTYEYIVNKYKLLRRFRNSKEYTESFLQTFCDHDKVLYITRNESLICGMLQWVKSADWNGKELYKLTIYLCDSVISRALLLCLDEFIQKKTKQYGKFAIVTYNDELKNIMEDMTDAREEGYVKYIITPDKQRKFNESNKKTNITHHCYMIFNDCSEMVAKSNVSVNNNDPRFPYQFMIGVKKTIEVETWENGFMHLCIKS